ncbi:MAG TPA: hypothetical protein P5218_10010 [Planctomycetota bacterium]|nr:hypothetical protein [Planctomycetota bacterium]
MMRPRLWGFLAALSIAGGAIAQDGPSREDVVEALGKAIGHLVDIQNPDGSWCGKGPESVLEDDFALQTYASWALGAQALACSALRGSVRGNPEQLRALERSVDSLCRVPMPERDSDWDIDYVWAAVYGLSTCVELLQDPRFQGPEWAPKIEQRGKQFLAVLIQNQALDGGWAYYDGPPYAKTPTWSTSFTTAAVLPALYDAKELLGWDLDAKVLERGKRYLERCALPNGAYSYSLEPVTGVDRLEDINQVQGSLGRIQVCNWALHRAGVRRITPEILREGLENLFRYHGFLDHARTRPIPHEGFYANAGYFYFFAHYYAAKVIALLPPAERPAWYRKLVPHLIKTQWANGGASDFLRSPYMVVASTSFLAAGLQADLDAIESKPESESTSGKPTASETEAEPTPQAKPQEGTPK